MKAVFHDVRDSVGAKRKAPLRVTNEEDTKYAKREHTIGKVQKSYFLKMRMELSHDIDPFV